MTEENTLATSSGNPLGEISQAPQALDVFLDKHQMKLIVLVVFLAILAASYVVFKGLRESAEESAGNLLVSSNEISDLQSITKNHQGTAAAFSAKVLLAEKQWEDGQQDDAVETLRAFVDTDGTHPGRASAQASLASKLRSQGKVDEAEKIFRDLTEDTEARFLAPYAWISLGDIELKKGDSDAAAKAYEAVERDFPESSHAQEAMNRRLLLKATAPVEVSVPTSVPEVRLIDDEAGVERVPTLGGDVEFQDLLDAVKAGSVENPANPLVPDENSPETSE